MRRLVSTWLAAVLASTALIALQPMPAAAYSTNCQATPSQDNWFTGEGQGTNPNVQGVRATIDFANAHLCTQSPSGPSWFLSWVGIQGPVLDHGHGVNIYQGGYAKCVYPAGPTSCPPNGGHPYYWFFYSYEDGPCGVTSNSTFIKVKGNVSAPATDPFKIVFKPADATWHFSIDGTSYDTRTNAAINECWVDGITGADWFNEMLNPGDQNGGTDSDRQEFLDAQLMYGGAWQDINRTENQPCGTNSNTADWHCKIEVDDHNSFKQWDDRY